MKSLISAVNDEDERLFRNALPNASQVPAGKTPAAVRLIAASPNSARGQAATARSEDRVGDRAGVDRALCVAGAERFTRLPQQGSELLEKHWLVAPLVTHVSRPSVGVPLPPKS